MLFSGRVNNMSEVMISSANIDNQINLKKVILNIFIIYYVVSGIFIALIGRDQYNYGFQSSIVFESFFTYFTLPIAILLVLKFKFHYSLRTIAIPFITSVFFTLFVWAQIIDLHNRLIDEGHTWIYGAYGAWYAFIGTILFIYAFRNKIRIFFKNVSKKTTTAVNSSFKLVKKHGFKATLIPFFLEWWTVRKLQNNYRAVYFAKKFIIIQAKPIKASLPGLLPSTVSASVKDIFQNDIDRMHQLFKYNHITTYSKSATLKFVMKVAEPIIKDLQLALEQHLTEELLKESNSAKNMSIDVDNLWKKIEKIMTNWQSTFTESEFEYKDNLLVK